jgi:hypothetical protein
VTAHVASATTVQLYKHWNHSKNGLKTVLPPDRILIA